MVAVPSIRRSTREMMLGTLCVLATMPPFMRARVVDGQEPPRRPPMVAYDRTERCLACHADLKSGTDFVANMSAKTWQEEDKHRRAMMLLEEQEPLTRQILGFPLADVVQDGQLRRDVTDRVKVDAVEKCMRCHATWPKGQDEPPVELRLGVSCQACHGPGFHWSRAHEEKWWRLCSTAEKERLGMRNLRSSAVKAALCASCHVGSVEEDRQVTHAMYAAGHPPLPGFELSAFAAQMPAHWRPLPEKGVFVGSAAAPYTLTAQDRLALSQLPVDPAAIKADYRSAHFPEHLHDASLDLVVPKEILAGGVAALRQYVEMVEASAKQRLEAPGGWPDFALYDCRACHHELRGGRVPDPSLAERIRRTPPGRPPAAVWPTILAQAAAHHLAADPANATDDEAGRFDEQLRVFEETFTDRPFGDAKKTATAAADLRLRLDKLAHKISVARFDEPALRRLTAALCQDPITVAGVRPSADFHTARQLAWSLERLLAIPQNEPTPLSVRESLPRIFRNDEGGDPLRLRLPAGQKSSIVEQLPAVLEASERYDPEWFRKRMESLKSEISPR